MIAFIIHWGIVIVPICPTATTEERRNLTLVHDTRGRIEKKREKRNEKKKKKENKQKRHSYTTIPIPNNH